MSTSWDITLVANHLAEQNSDFHGCGITGLQTPEQFMDGALVLRQLEKRMGEVNR